MTATALAELARRAGIPAGVLNIVVGDAKAIGEHGNPWLNNTAKRRTLRSPGTPTLCHVAGFTGVPFGRNSLDFKALALFLSLAGGESR